jgi:DNA repair protein RecO (recombination protein O)
MIVKTSGVVLRLDPFSRTSQIVTWLTPTHGRVVTLAKGAKRRRNDFLGGYDLYYTCEVLFYLGNRRSVHLLKECSPILTRDRFRTDWRACAVASYFCDMLNRTAVSEPSQAALFDLADRTLTLLSREGASAESVLWFELALCSLLGLSPKLASCSVCGNACDAGGETRRFSIARGGLLCSVCAAAQGGTQQTIPSAVLRTLDAWQRVSLPHSAAIATWPGRQQATAERLLGDFLDYHVGTSSRSRRVALSLLRL